MYKKALLLVLMTAYLYTLAFSIFMPDAFRIPAVITVFPLLLFKHPSAKGFEYSKELILCIAAVFLYNVVGMNDFPGFFATSMVIGACFLYFNYFIGSSKTRLHATLAIFATLLFASMVVMVFDHYSPTAADQLRSKLLGEQVKQSPAGIATTQFTFGYQVVSFTTFLFLTVLAYRRHLFVQIIGFLVCLVCLYLGMNRSAFVCFSAISGIYILAAFRFKGLLLIIATVAFTIAVSNYAADNNLGGKDNILSKNRAKEANDFNREDLSAENLKIIGDYPFGLIFYNKKWEDVVYKNPRFPAGLSSHNAYLMFITYLGPIVGTGMLLMLYLPLASAGVRLIRRPAEHEPLLIATLGAFLALSLNALSHNGWLLNADGPSVFFFFCLLHLLREHKLVEHKQPQQQTKPTYTLTEFAV
ncbi:hypothetical protein C8P68_104167 [Mucilaginibacter yixingensis]|uniref:O-antigen ligase n=1 Tax=Mucilaginibacter yixingensis TaxID=1295612 RepID=A0A2T5J9C7_9SPHI|nr:hypothetical protein [Mucilaginibacter yixingensis]PTQ96681.1 hypothetical protein C8P68_104167 [Mucilaginibacter yixingensis]